MKHESNLKTNEAREKFRKYFFSYPEEFKGLMQDPYYYQQYQQEGHDLLKLFGFCPMCEGTGHSFTECCWGHGCPCNGQPVKHTCNCCNGTGIYVDGEFDAEGNHKYITKLSEINKGYLFPQPLPF